jgi:hypothetical protein
VNEKRHLPIRPVTLNVKRDLADMAPVAVVALCLRSPSASLLKRLDDQRRLRVVSVGPVELVPRNSSEMWPARVVRVERDDGVMRWDATVSLDEHWRPLVTLRATPLQS